MTTARVLLLLVVYAAASVFGHRHPCWVTYVNGKPSTFAWYWARELPIPAATEWSEWKATRGNVTTGYEIFSVRYRLNTPTTVWIDWRARRTHTGAFEPGLRLENNVYGLVFEGAALQ